MIKCFSGIDTECFPPIHELNIRRGIEVVITGLTRNQFASNRTRVRIPPSPPQTQSYQGFCPYDWAFLFSQGHIGGYADGRSGIFIFLRGVILNRNLRTVLRLPNAGHRKSKKLGIRFIYIPIIALPVCGIISVLFKTKNTEIIGNFLKRYNSDCADSRFARISLRRRD